MNNTCRLDIREKWYISEAIIALQLSSYMLDPKIAPIFSPSESTSKNVMEIVGSHVIE